MMIQNIKTRGFSKIALLVVLIAVVIVIGYAYQGYKKFVMAPKPTEQIATSTPKTVSADGTVVLVVGESATIDGFTLTLDAISQDSRCPVDVTCIQAGWVTAQVSLREGQMFERKELSSNKPPYEVGKYSISLDAVAPFTHSKNPILQKDYRVTFKIIQKQV